MPEQAGVGTAPPDKAEPHVRPGRGARLLAIAWFSALYLPATLLIASRRPFWNDELFTYYIARQPGLAGIWDALTTGADQIPPLFYWITRACMSLPGNPLILMRLPEIAGSWLMGLCLAAFVWRRLPSLYGLLAALAALSTGAYAYAYEARPYGVVAGLGALALLCWQRADGRHRVLWVGGLAASLAASVSMHYYAVFLFLPLAGAEAVRFWTRHRWRWHVWGALVVGAAPLLVYLPLIRAARTYSGTFWAKPGITSIVTYAQFLIGPGLLAFCLLLLAAGLWHLWSGPRGRRKPEARPTDEIAAIVLFLSIPVFALAVALTVTGAFTPRYALSAAIGAGVFAAWLMAAAFDTGTRPAILAACLLSLFILARDVHDFRRTVQVAASHASIIRYLSGPATSGMPVTIADPQLFFELSHEAPPQLQSRLRYFAEPLLALQYLGTDTVDRCLVTMSRWAPLRLESFQKFLGSGESILIYGYPAVWEWAVQDLVSRKVPVSAIGAYENRLLLAAGPVTAERHSGDSASAPRSGATARR